MSVRDLSTIAKFLQYDPETGLFRWHVLPNNRATAGWTPGVNMNGYRLVRFGGKQYRCHRLAWWFVHGHWPERVDHINGNPGDNRISNLRLCTQAQNVANKRGHSPTGQFKGVRQRRSGKFEAQLGKAYRIHYLGVYDTAEQAARAYDAAARKHFGQFARPNFKEVPNAE